VPFKVPLPPQAMAMLDELQTVKSDRPYIFANPLTGRRITKDGMLDLLQKATARARHR
jgi:hypothetical protein